MPVTLMPAPLAREQKSPSVSRWTKPTGQSSASRYRAVSTPDLYPGSFTNARSVTVARCDSCSNCAWLNAISNCANYSMGDRITTGFRIGPYISSLPVAPSCCYLPAITRTTHEKPHSHINVSFGLLIMVTTTAAHLREATHAQNCRRWWDEADVPFSRAPACNASGRYTRKHAPVLR